MGHDSNRDLSNPGESAYPDPDAETGGRREVVDVEVPAQQIEAPSEDDGSTPGHDSRSGDEG